MTVLYISRKVGQGWTECAEGDGDPSSSEEFPVTLRAGRVQKGTTYKLEKGKQKADLGRYACTAGADSSRGDNKIAKFTYAGDVSVLETSGTLAAYSSFRSALLASQKQVTIEIGLDDLKNLKAANYKLCFAKKIGDEEYNVVWQAYTEYLANNNFSWTPQYQLFGSNTFQDNLRVAVSTNIVSIGLGELSVLDSAGILEVPSTGGPATSLNLDNQYGSIHPGVSQLSTGIDGQQVSTPIYVAVNPIVKGQTGLTPVEKVMVWFEQHVETSTMFSTSRSMAVEIDMTFTNQATRLYQDQVWSTP